MHVRECPARLAAPVLLASALLLANIALAQETEPRNLSFEEPAEAPGGRPPGWWFIEHAGPVSFEFAIDDKVAKEGKQSLRIRRTGNQPYGVVLQTIRADRFRSKRARLTAFLRLDNVDAYGRGALREMSGAALMLRSQGGGAMVLDDMRDHPLRGTKPWTKVSVKIDVPAMATVLEFGAILSGSGTLWADAFRLEVVEPSAAAEPAAK